MECKTTLWCSVALNVHVEWLLSCAELECTVHHLYQLREGWPHVGVDIPTPLHYHEPSIEKYSYIQSYIPAVMHVKYSH